MASAPPRHKLRLIVHKNATGGLIGKGGSIMQSIATRGVWLSIQPFTCVEKRVDDVISDRIVALNYQSTDALFEALKIIAPILREARIVALQNLVFPKTIPDNEHLFTIPISRWSAQQLLAGHGNILKSVQSQVCSVRIRDALPQSDELVCQFKGELMAVCQAVVYCINYLTQPNPPTPDVVVRQYTPSMPVESTDLIIDRIIQIPQSMVKYVLGKKGERVKEIKTKTSCHVHLPPDSLRATQPGESPDRLVSVHVRGPSKNMSGAVQMVFRAKDAADFQAKADEQKKKKELLKMMRQQAHQPGQQHRQQDQQNNMQYQPMEQVQQQQQPQQRMVNSYYQQQ